MDNANTKDYLDKIRTQVVENLKRTAFAPSVQMTDVPRDPLVGGMDDEADAVLDDLDEDENKDKRFTKRRFDQYIEKPGELSDSEDEEEDAANGIRRQPHPLKRKNEANFRGLDAADSGIDSGLATPHEPSSVADEDIDMAEDTGMGEAPEPDTGSPSAAEPESRAEEASALEPAETTVNGLEQPTSAPMSRQVSPKAHGEDMTMEDVQEPATEEQKEPEQPEYRAEAEQAEQTEQPEQPEQPGQPEQFEAPKQPEHPEPAEEAETPNEAAQEESKPAEEAGPAQTAEAMSSPTEAPEVREPAAETAKESPEGHEGPGAMETEQAPPKEPTPEKPEEPAKQEE
jgi:histone deacetylase 1/2